MSPQQHYDWGLRALKTVLRGSGNLLQIARRQQSNSNANGKFKGQGLFMPTVSEMLRKKLLINSKLAVTTMCNFFY